MLWVLVFYLHSYNKCSSQLNMCIHYYYDVVLLIFFTLEKLKGQASMDTPEDISNIDNTRHRTKKKHTHTHTHTTPHRKLKRFLWYYIDICEWNGIWDCLIVSFCLLYPVIKKTSLDLICRFVLAIFMCLSQAMTWISTPSYVVVFVMFNGLRWDVIVHFVDLGGITV